MEYKVIVREVHWGYILVDAVNKDAAESLAEQNLNEFGLENTIDYEFDIKEVQKVN